MGLGHAPLDLCKLLVPYIHARYAPKTLVLAFLWAGSLRQGWSTREQRALMPTSAPATCSGSVHLRCRHFWACIDGCGCRWKRYLQGFTVCGGCRLANVWDDFEHIDWGCRDGGLLHAIEQDHVSYLIVYESSSTAWLLDGGAARQPRSPPQQQPAGMLQRLHQQQPAAMLQRPHQDGMPC